MCLTQHLIHQLRSGLLAFSLACSLSVSAAEISDETESPALRKPLPVLAAPEVGAEGPAVFSTEVPPPPPFDPTYQPPQPATVKEDAP
jgi:hypothetical protein